MLEIWKGATGNKAFGALVTNLSKAFNCLSHVLLIAKLHVYGVDISLNIVQIFELIVSKKQNLIFFVALEKQYSPEYLKTLYLDHFCSIYLCDVSCY